MLVSKKFIGIACILYFLTKGLIFMKITKKSKNGGCGMLEKVISSFIAATVVISSFTSLIGSSLDNSYFKFDRNSSGGYNVSLNPKADFSNTPEVEFPSTYNDGSGDAEVTFTRVGISGNSSIRSISIPTASPGNLMAFQGLNALEEVKYTYSGELTFSAITFMNSSATLNKIYIDASSVTFSGALGPRVFMGFVDHENAKIIVTSNDVKQQIINGTKNGVPVSEDKIEVVESGLPKPTIEITCENIKYKTEGGFKPSAVVKLNGVPMDPQPTVSYELYTDQDCNNKSTRYDSSLIFPGTYYLRASVAGTEEYQAAFAVKEVVVEELTDKTALRNVIAQADEILGGDTSAYVEATVQDLELALQNNRGLLTNYDATEEQVTAATKAIQDAIDGLFKKDDLPDEEHLQKFNDALAKYRNIQKENYTDDSWQAFSEALAEMNEMRSRIGYTKNEDIDAICTKIENAFNGLEEKPLDYTPLESAIAEAKTNYIDKEAELKSTYTEETWKTLKDAYEAGQQLLAGKGSEDSSVTNVTISNATIRIQNAIKWLVTVDQQKAFDELQELITKAGTYDSAEYTTSSYKTLTDAITEAKKISISPSVLTSISTLEEIKNATDKLQKAIDGLNHAAGFLPAGDPFAYIYYGALNSNALASGTYDGTTPVAKIRFTFDCSSNANYGPNSSIELQAKVNGSEIAYGKITGTSATEPNGSKNAKAILNLKDHPIEAGQNYELFAWTYANQGLSEYVFAITKIELLDDEGNILKSFNDITAARDSLKQSVDTAKKLAEVKDEYTAESYAKVVEAIAEAEKVIANENATKSELEAAAAALRKAIGDLKDKEDPSQQGGSSNQTVKPTTPTKAAPITTRSREVVKKDKSKAKQAMKTAKITKLKVKSKTKKKINVTWKKVSKAKGYQVQVSTTKKFKKSKIIFNKFTKKKTLKISSKKIKSKKTYYVRVRAYTTYNDINGKPQKVYSKWNKKLRTVKVK